MILTTFMITLAIVLIILTITYWTRYKDQPINIFSPVVSWIRAFIFFCSALLLSWATGITSKLLTTPIATPEQLQDPQWIAWTAGCFLLIFVAYWVIWARWTQTFDRKQYLIPQIVFGIFWGFSVGQIFLIIWSFCCLFSFALWIKWIIGYALISLVMGLWQDLYWDVYVIPEHDTPWSLKWKIVCSHIPNMLFCLTYLALYDNRLIFVILQTFSLTGSAIFMRFPPFWEKRYITPPRTLPGLFNLPHAAGYVPEDE